VHGSSDPLERSADPSGQSNGVGALQERPLDLHEGIRDPLEKGGCQRWPESLRLLNKTTGELRRGRCRATNLCPYCARLFAVETSEMLLLDAMEDAPTIYLVLTAREHLTRAQCTDHLRQLRRATRKQWPSIRWAVLVEFQRRRALHLNLLVKGVPVQDCERLREAAATLWCSRVDAEDVAQWAGVIADELGVVKYVTLHFMKQSQAPVVGWKGHRYSSTRDYLVRPASVMRREARRSLTTKRLLWKSIGRAEQIAGGVPTADLIEIVFEQMEAAESEASSWRLERVECVPARRHWIDTGRPIARDT
jgi:hypothetical protein